MQSLHSTEGMLMRMFLRLYAWNRAVGRFTALKKRDNSKSSADNALLELASAMALLLSLNVLRLAIAYAKLFNVSPNRVTKLAMPYTQAILLPSFILFYVWLKRRFRAISPNDALLDKYNSRSDRIKLFVGTVGFASILIVGAVVVGLLSRP